MNSILDSFKLNNTLNPEIWESAETNDFSFIKLKPEIRKALVATAKKFIDSFEISDMDIDDVIIVGSICNYNWSEYSDIDLHVVFDVDEFDADYEIIEQLFDAKKVVFNKKHNITIKGHDVELYAQRSGHEVSAAGIYSVLHDEWLRKPTKENIIFDKALIVKKIKDFNAKLEKIIKLDNSEQKVDELKELQEKILKYRQSGLSKAGEFSLENLVFKYLRRAGFIEKIKNLRTELEDKILSVENVEL